jgi:hypothetical protein
MKGTAEEEAHQNYRIRVNTRTRLFAFRISPLNQPDFEFTAHNDRQPTNI